MPAGRIPAGSAPAMAEQATLERIGATGLYSPESGETFIFLLWDVPAEPEPSIPLARTWADEGAADVVGYYVFVEAVPGGEDAVELEAKLRDALAEPETTGFAWAAFDPERAFELAGAVAVALDADDRPVIAADSDVAFPTGMPSFGFAGGLRALSVTGGDGMTGLAIVAAEAADGGRGPGLEVALLGAGDDDDAVGGIAFRALLRSTAEADRTVKELAAVRVDPLRPYDPERTYIRPVGAAYVLSVDSDGEYHLARASTAVEARA